MDNLTSQGYYNDGITNVKNDLENIKKNYLALGYHLKEIRDYKWYKYKYNNGSDKDFNDFCKDQFGFSKSTTYRLIEIVERFCKPDTYCLDDKYKDYSQSQLIEMLPMDSTDLDYVRPDMTVKEIRSLKSYDSKQKSDNDIIPGQVKIIDVYPDATPAGHNNDNFNPLFKELCNTIKEMYSGIDWNTKSWQEIFEILKDSHECSFGFHDAGNGKSLFYVKTSKDEMVIKILKMILFANLVYLVLVNIYSTIMKLLNQLIILIMFVNLMIP